MTYQGPVYGIGDGLVLRELKSWCFDLEDTDIPLIQLTIPLSAIQMMEHVAYDGDDQVIRFVFVTGKQQEFCLTQHAAVALRKEWEEQVPALTPAT